MKPPLLLRQVFIHIIFKIKITNLKHLFGDIPRKCIDERGDLYDKVRVLCWVMTSPGNHKTKAKAVKDTWGKRCNILLFMSSAEGIFHRNLNSAIYIITLRCSTDFKNYVLDESLPSVKLPVEEGRSYLWAKTREAFRYIWNNYRHQADWFFKADDDT